MNRPHNQTLPALGISCRKGAGDGDGGTAVQPKTVLQWFGGREDFIAFHEEYKDWQP